MSYQHDEAEGGGLEEGDEGYEAESALRAFRRAVHDLYRASLPDEMIARLQGPGPLAAPLGAAEAARSLGQQPGVDRLFKLHAVASAVNRKPALAESSDARRGLAEAILPDDGERDGRSGDFLAQRIEAFADQARGDPTGLTPARWQAFVTTLEEPEATDRAVSLVSKPGCNDEQVVPTPRGNAATIRSRFWTHLSLAEASEFIDPQSWTIYGRPFWRRMALVDGTREAFHTSTSDGYTAVFEEVVDLPVIGPVRVYLHVTYERSDDHVSVVYRLADAAYPNEAVTFDSGWLYATSPTTGPHDETTYVDGLKAIRFRDPQHNELPHLACDGGWAHFMINMALAGAGLPGGRQPVGPAVVPPPAAAPTPVLASAAAGQLGGVAGDVAGNVGRLIDDWVAATATSLQAQGEALTSAVGRALSPRPDPRWINDVVGMGQTAMATTKMTVDTWRRILTELAKMGDER